MPLSLRWSLVRLLGGRAPWDDARVEIADTLQLPVDSCTVSAKRVSVSYFTERTYSKLSGHGPRLSSLILSLHGVARWNASELEWDRISFDLETEGGVYNAVDTLQVLTKLGPDTLMHRLEPDERNVLLVAYAWACHAQKRYLSKLA